MTHITLELGNPPEGFATPPTNTQSVILIYEVDDVNNKVPVGYLAIGKPCKQCFLKTNNMGIKPVHYVFVQEAFRSKGYFKKALQEYLKQVKGFVVKGPNMDQQLASVLEMVEFQSVEIAKDSYLVKIAIGGANVQNV